MAWDNVPKCLYVVSEAEMETLVNNYTLCCAKDPNLSASPNKPVMTRKPGPKNSKLRKSKWSIAKTFLGTEAGRNGRFPHVEKNQTGWCQGTLVRFDGSNPEPYVIEWDTEPKCSYTVTEGEIKVLAQNYKRCAERQLLGFFLYGKRIIMGD